MPAPEINVRLTADGVQDVVNAFHRVQQEAKGMRGEATLAGQAMEQLGALMPVISIGLVVNKLVEMGKAALETTVSIGRLAEKTGASVGTLSVLAESAHDVNVEQDQLGTVLTKLARSQEQASQGSSKQAKAFQALGISMSDIRAKDPGAMFVKIAEQMQKMPAGAQRAAVSMELFGRSGAEVIPLLNEIGKANGFEEAKQKAQQMGMYLSDEFVAQALAGEKALKDLQDVTEGLTMRFMSGFMPEATKALVDFNNTVSTGSTNAWANWGKGIGVAVDGVVNVFLTASQTIAVVWSSMITGLKDSMSGLLQVAGKLVSGDFKGGLVAFKSNGQDFQNHQKGIWGAYYDMLRQEWTGKAPKITAKTPTPATGGSGPGVDSEKALKEHQKLVDARAAYEETVAAGELQKQKALDQQREAQDKESYAAGLETLQQYYDARAQRINAEADAERAILQKKLDAEEAAASDLMGKSKKFIDALVKQGPEAVEAAAGTNTAALAMLGKIAATRAQMDADETKRQTELQQNETERDQAEAQAVQKVLDARMRLFQLEGNTAAARQASLEREIQQADELMKTLGISAEQRAAIVNGARATGTARNNLQTLSEQGGGQFQDLNNQVSLIQSAAASGAISQLSAESQILAVERQRLPILQSIAGQMQQTLDAAKAQLDALLKGTEEWNAQAHVVSTLQQQVDQFTAQVYNLASSMQNVTTLSVELSNRMSMEGIGAAVGFFDSISDGSKSASEAFANLGKDFEKIITHMIDQMLVYYALMAIVGWLAPNSNFATSLKKSGPFGGITGHAAGGYTGNAPVDEVAGVVHGKEFVFNAAATQKWGLPLLEAMNAGVRGINSGSSYGSLSSGSGASGGGSGPLVELNIDTGGQPAKATQRTGPGGKSIIDVVVGEVASDIAGGGKVGQAIQSTFGVSRKGVVRG